MNPSRRLNHLFIALQQGLRAHERLVRKPIQAQAVYRRPLFAALVVYIHHNPQQHGLVADFRRWGNSSYRALLSSQTTRLQRDTVLAWFDGPDAFVGAHLLDVDEARIGRLIADDN